MHSITTPIRPIHPTGVGSRDDRGIEKIEDNAGPALQYADTRKGHFRALG